MLDMLSLCNYDRFLQWLLQHQRRHLHMQQWILGERNHLQQVLIQLILVSLWNL